MLTWAAKTLAPRRSSSWVIVPVFLDSTQKYQWDVIADVISPHGSLQVSEIIVVCRVGSICWARIVLLVSIGVGGVFVRVVGGVFAWEELLVVSVLESCEWGVVGGRGGRRWGAMKPQRVSWRCVGWLARCCILEFLFQGGFGVRGVRAGVWRRILIMIDNAVHRHWGKRFTK